SNLDLILEEIFKFIVENYKIDFGFIQLKEDTFLKTKKVGNYSNILSEEQLNYVENLKIPLNESGGVSFKTYKRKKPTFMPLSLMNQLFTKDYPGFELDKMLIEQMHLTSFLIIPLIIQNEVIGLAFFTSHLSDLKFTKKEISRIEGFCNQIVGAIYNGNLLSETNKAKSEIEFLNEFSRTINASNKLEEIFTTAILELNQRLGVDFFILELIDEKKNELFTRCFSGQVSPEYFQFINETKIPLVKESGSIFLPFDKRKSIYLKSINIISSNKLSKYDRIMRDELGFNSFFHLPLMVNDKVIGIFQINKIGGMKRLSKDEIKFAESLCDQLANAVNNSYLIEKTEKQKKESEQLNKLMKNINSVSSLSDIMMFFMLYLEKNLGFKDFALITHEESENSLNVHSFVSPKITNDNKFYLHSLKMDISSLTGIFAELYKYKKLIFINKENIPEEDFYANEFIERGSLDYLLLTPMIIYGELVGILLVHAPIDKLEVTESITEKVNRFSDMVAGSVFNAKLLKKVEETGEIAETERQKSEKLLLNILPKDVATELKEKGFSEPVLFDSVSVMFTDFKGFTQIAETLTPQELVKDLDACFVQFDKISERYNLEKLKTIGDSYMCAGGIPRKNVTHAIDSVLAAMEIQDFMNMMKDLKEKKGFPYWEIRLGIHTGPLVAGVIGEKKFAYDVWGDTVNTASRMESSGTPGKINISGTTYDLVKDLFECEYRGKVNAKNKGEVDMYYVYGLKEEYSKEGDRKTPNGKFWELYSKNE
ncbi:MAG: GAF domain-containing protein, partial [Leptospiraceae bacterium]|nr:GAF domain-containing protein [Leptospiraceae bacterium]